MKLALLFAGLVTATALHATPVFDNTTTDTLFTATYSTGGYTEIGDRIQLAGTERSGSSATVQFFNAGIGSGNFDATLHLYGFSAGNPGVGSSLGSFLLSNNVLASGGTLDVTWLLNGLVLPDELFFTVSVDNVSADMDLGLNLFDPPTVGSSSNQFYIVGDSNGGFAQVSSTLGVDNFYFRLDATGANRIPEPGSAGLVFLAMLPLLAMRGRRSVLR